MKKFVSIVIALVMVLSMTSAFAAPIKKDCAVLDFTYNCAVEDTFCGKGKVDVVPYVKNAIACKPYWEFVANECAGIMASETAYYAIAVTVDAYPDPAWWDAADLEIEYDGIAAALTNANLDAAMAKLNTIIDAAAYDYTEAHTFYLKNDGGFGWVEDDDADFSANAVPNLLFAGIASKKAAEVCVTLSSYNNGLNADGYEYDGYVFKTNANYLTVSKDGKTVAFSDLDKDGVIDLVHDGAKGQVDPDFYAEVTGKFNLGCGIGTCINADNWEAIFGWDYEQEDCANWGAVQSVIVNPDCSVEIPKTGDVSVVAYAVMAIVAAAGTMLKK